MFYSCYVMSNLILTVILLSGTVWYMIECSENGQSIEHLCNKKLQFSSHVSSHNGQCFHFISKEKTWIDANRFCNEHGSHLIKVSDRETHNFIVKLLGTLWWNNNGIWIGLNDIRESDNWKWAGISSIQSDDLDKEFSNWGNGHPNGVFNNFRNCVRMVRLDNHNSPWNWHETFCNMWPFNYRFICQYDAKKLTRPSSESHTLNRISSGNYQIITENTKVETEKKERIFLEDEPKVLPFEFLPSQNNDKQEKTNTYLILVCSVISLIIFSLMIGFLLFARKRRRDESEKKEVIVQISKTCDYYNKDQLDLKISPNNSNINQFLAKFYPNTYYFGDRKSQSENNTSKRVSNTYVNEATQKLIQGSLENFDKNMLMDKEKYQNCIINHLTNDNYTYIKEDQVVKKASKGMQIIRQISERIPFINTPIHNGNNVCEQKSNIVKFSGLKKWSLPFSNNNIISPPQKDLNYETENVEKINNDINSYYSKIKIFPNYYEEIKGTIDAENGIKETLKINRPNNDPSFSIFKLGMIKELNSLSSDNEKNETFGAALINNCEKNISSNKYNGYLVPVADRSKSNIDDNGNTIEKSKLFKNSNANYELESAAILENNKIEEVISCSALYEKDTGEIYNHYEALDDYYRKETY